MSEYEAQEREPLTFVTEQTDQLLAQNVSMYVEYGLLHMFNLSLASRRLKINLDISNPNPIHNGSRMWGRYEKICTRHRET